MAESGNTSIKGAGRVLKSDDPTSQLEFEDYETEPDELEPDEDSFIEPDEDSDDLDDDLDNDLDDEVDAEFDDALADSDEDDDHKKRRAATSDDDDGDDTEEDLDAMLRARLGTEEDDEDEDEEPKPAPNPRAGSLLEEDGGEFSVKPRQASEWVCAECFLIVSKAANEASGCPHCGADIARARRNLAAH